MGRTAPATPNHPEELERLRTEAGRLLRPDDLRVIQAVVAEGRPLAEVAAEFNSSPDALNEQLAQALADLAAFVEKRSAPPRDGWGIRRRTQSPGMMGEPHDRRSGLIRASPSSDNPRGTPAEPARGEHGCVW